MFYPQTILITGCSSGIGLCAALTLHQRGHTVFAGVRNSHDQSRLAQQGLKTVLLDLNDSLSIQAGLQQVFSQTQNKLDVLINNAGYGQMGAIEDLSREALRAQFETNVFGLQELTNLVLPVFRKQKQGKIINVSSLLGFVTMPYRGAYCASKYALEALSDALRLELRGSGISVSIIEPGPITSQFRDNARAVYQKSIDTEHSAHQTEYTDLMDRAAAAKENSAFTKGPEAVVDKMLKIIESKRPKIRYPVTLPSYLLAALKRLLPARILDEVLRRV